MIFNINITLLSHLIKHDYCSCDQESEKIYLKLVALNFSFADFLSSQFDSVVS